MRLRQNSMMIGELRRLDMTFNYAELVVAIRREAEQMQQAQATGNYALLISIASRMTRLSAVLAHNLEKESA